MVEQVAKVKNRSIVYYTRFGFKKYNEKSKENLIQNEQKKHQNSSLYQRIVKQTSVNDINAYVKAYEMAREQISEKPLRYAFSKQQASKISEITNVFIRSVLSGYVAGSGFKQRSVTFCTLTLSESQKHTDKELIRCLAKFIDDIKRVKNYLICPITKKQLNETALPIVNYVWRAETTENGNIHFHILFDSFINKNTLNRVWNNHLERLGYERSYSSTRIESLKKVQDVGAYITKYMTKPPLKNKFKDMKKEDLKNYVDSEKYRRPIIGKAWGCSKAVLKLKYIDFVENDMVHIEELKDQLKEYESPLLPDFVRVYVGNVRSCLKNCSYRLQGIFKKWYKRSYEILYKLGEFAESVSELSPEPKKKVNYYQLGFNF